MSGLSINYARPFLRRDVPHPAIATLLCLASAFCWCVFFSLLGLRIAQGVPNPTLMAQVFLRFVRFLPPQGLMLCWAVAVLCAIVSLGLYWRRPKPWYVRLNLAINSAGLIFTGGLLFLALTGSFLILVSIS
jgi:hypothetical protein